MIYLQFHPRFSPFSGKYILEFFSLWQAPSSIVPASRKRSLPDKNEAELLDPAKIAKYKNGQTQNDTQDDDDFFIETKDEEPMALAPGFSQY